jgi:hypothetical protein
MATPLDAPFAMPGAPDMFSSLLSSMGTGAQGNPMTVAPPPPKTWLDRLLPLIHLVSMVALGIYAVTVWEPTTRLGDPSAKGLIDWGGWAALGRRNVSQDEIATVVGIMISSPPTAARPRN